MFRKARKNLGPGKIFLRACTNIGAESAPVLAHTAVHYNIHRAAGCSSDTSRRGRNRSRHYY